VHVPWEPAAIRGRKRMVKGIILLWLTFIAWIALGEVNSGPVLEAVLSVYALITLAGGVEFYRRMYRYRCTDCNLRWRI